MKAAYVALTIYQDWTDWWHTIIRLARTAIQISGPQICEELTEGQLKAHNNEQFILNQHPETG